MTAARSAIRKDIDLMEYWRIVWKHKTIVFSTFGVCLGVAAILSFIQTPQYQAVARILIEEQGSNKFNLQDFLNSPAGGANDFLGTYFNTQLRIIQSRALAERVVKKKNLASRPEFQAPSGGRRSLLAMVKYVVTFRWLKSKPGGQAPAEAGAMSEEADVLAAGIFLKKLAVYPVPETRLVDVTFTSLNASFAAEVVNDLAKEYIDYTIESRSEATQQTSDFINDTLALKRGELSAKEQQLQRYAKEKKILPLNEKDQAMISQYGSAAAALNSAEVARVVAFSKYQELKSLQTDISLQNVADPTIQKIRADYLQTKAEYDQKTSTLFTPSHPDMIQLKARVDSLKNQLDSEIKKAVDAAYSQYAQALDTENRLKQLRDAKQSEVNQQNSDSLYYSSLNTEVDGLKKMISELTSSQQTTQVSTMLSGLKTSNIKIIDRALVPEKPSSPNVKRNLIVAFLLGLMGGVGLAFIAHFLDNTVKNPEVLDKLTGLPSLGMIPHFSPNGTDGRTAYATVYGDTAALSAEAARVSEVELINHLFPKISIAEDYRTVRTSILFSRVDPEHKIFAFTSTQPQEGKSATVSNIAISFAQMGERVLAIDADLRKPRLHKIFQVRNGIGLSDVLTGRCGLEEAVQKTPVAHFSLLPSGPHPPNPAELLNSKRMKELLAAVRDRFDYIFIDLPPVLAVIDPLIVAALADMTIIVLKTGKTTRKPLLRTIEELRKAKARVAGVIFNDAEVKKTGAYSPYFQYEYFQDASVTDEVMKKAVEKPEEPVS
jgi:capsular exopolysaccharide synthesis family protein